MKKRSVTEEAWTYLIIAAIVPLAGCGSGYQREVAKVTGTVKCDGQLLTEGIVIFTPKEVATNDNLSQEDFAKGARGEIQSDGTYELSTYKEGDGAVVGVHDVRVMQVDPEDDDAPVVNGGFACSREVLQLTVEPGRNVIDIEMTRDG
jgi:hypothetical protein